MTDPGWDLWDAKRVRAVLWPSTVSWPDAEELWPEAVVSPPCERGPTVAPIRASDVEPRPGPLWITYWAWAMGTPFVKIGQTEYGADRDGRWRGKEALAKRRIGGWTTGCMYRVQLIRVHLDDVKHERIEHARREVAQVRPRSEWFDLRRLSPIRADDIAQPGITYAPASARTSS